MATQTGSIDLKAAKAAADIAKDTSAYFWTNTQDSGAGEGVGAHITKITSSEFIADPANGGGNVLIDTDSVDVRDGATNLATFGASGARIGQSGDTHLEIDYHSLKLVDKEASTYLYISDLRDTNGNITITTEGDGTTTAYSARFPVSGVSKITIDGVETTAYTYSDGVVTFNTAPSDGSIIAFTYIPDSQYNDGYKAFTIGLRKYNNVAPFTYALGYKVNPSNPYAYAEGYMTEAGYMAHAEGLATVAGYVSHSEGAYTEANGNYSHAEGVYSKAQGDGSYAGNYYTIAQGAMQTAIGRFNVAQGDPNTAHNSDYAFIIGNGTADNARSNALTVDWSGNITANGKNINSFITNFQTPISTSKSSVSIPTTTYTTIDSVNLPANGKYIVIASGGIGTNSGVSQVVHRLNVTSGTAVIARNPTQHTIPHGGGYASITGYYETGSTGITVSFQSYLYQGTATGGNCWIEAFQIA